MSLLACSIASRSLRAKPAWSTVSSDFRFSRRRCGTVVAHIELATSPDTSPPIPSATSSSKPSAPRVWLQREAARQSSPVERLKITKVSSLFLRTRPISERPKALTSIRALSELASRLTSPLPCYLPHPERRCPLDDPWLGFYRGVVRALSNPPLLRNRRRDVFGVIYYRPGRGYFLSRPGKGRKVSKVKSESVCGFKRRATAHLVSN